MNVNGSTHQPRGARGRATVSDVDQGSLVTARAAHATESGSLMLRPCSTPGCKSIVTSGRCQKCAGAAEQNRGTAHQRGYGAAWMAFYGHFIATLVQAGIAPVCGAVLPAGPQTNHSRCKAEGLETWTNADGSRLHRDHEPPLEDHERADPEIVMNPTRLQLLCASCHSAKTARETGYANSLGSRAPQTTLALSRNADGLNDFPDSKSLEAN